MSGLYSKYIVTKRNGPTDPTADYFVLRLDTDARARHAARMYARNIAEENPELAADLEARCDKHAFEDLEKHPECWPQTWEPSR